MKVRKLIEELSLYDGDLDVLDENENDLSTITVEDDVDEEEFLMLKFDS